MSRMKWIGLSVLVVLVIIVTLQNSEPTTTKILFMTFTMPLAVLIFVAAVISFVAGLLAARIRGRKKKIESTQ